MSKVLTYRGFKTVADWLLGKIFGAEKSAISSIDKVKDDSIVEINDTEDSLLQQITNLTNESLNSIGGSKDAALSDISSVKQGVIDEKNNSIKQITAQTQTEISSITSAKNSAVDEIQTYVNSASFMYVGTKLNYQQIYNAGSAGATVTVDGTEMTIIYNANTIYLTSN